MILRVDGDTFYLESRYEEREEIKAAGGFRWNKEAKRWETRSVDSALKFSGKADPWVRDRIQEIVCLRREAIVASRAVDSDFHPPAPPGLSYLPFQRAGIAYGIARRGVLLGEEMGLGKTIEALGIINALPPGEAEKVLVISPASLKLNWRMEANRWLVRPRRIEIADSLNFPSVPKPSMIICNYDILRRHHDAIHSEMWDVLIADEAHFLKNSRAQRTLEVVGGRAKKKKGETKGEKFDPIPARRRIFLTGTPILNRPIEIWPVAHALAPDEFPDFWKFTGRYCERHQNRYGWDMKGASNLNELQEKLRASFLIRRLKSEVMTELPPKRRQIVPLDPEGHEDVIRAERDAYDRHAEETQDLRLQVEMAKASEDAGEYERAVEALSKANRTAFAEMAVLRHETARAKAPHVIEHIQECLEEEDKIVVFAHHLDVIAQIKGAFPGKAVSLTGEMKIEDRQRAVDRFQQDPSCQVFIGSIKAAGLGITLTAASHVVFAELDWVPAAVSQAEDRLHRISQKGSVLVQHLIFDGSLDADMAKTLVAKQAIIDQALDDGIAQVEVEAEPPATASVSRRAVERDAGKITEDQVAAVHETLRMLAGMCDGAQARDGAGFSRMDARLGHSLASEPRLTNKQAALGLRICLRYRRQYDAARLARLLGPGREFADYVDAP